VWLEKTYELFRVTTGSIFREIITSQNALLFIGIAVKTSNLTSGMSCPSATFIDHMEKVVQEMEGRGRICFNVVSAVKWILQTYNEVCLSLPASSLIIRD